MFSRKKELTITGKCNISILKCIIIKVIFGLSIILNVLIINILMQHNSLLIYLKGECGHFEDALPPSSAVVEDLVPLALLPKAQTTCSIVIRITNPL